MSKTRKFPRTIPRLCFVGYGCIPQGVIFYDRAYRTVGYGNDGLLGLKAEPVGYSMKVVQKSLDRNGYFYRVILVPGVGVNFSHRSCRAVEYRYERLTEFTEPVGSGQNTRVNMPRAQKIFLDRVQRWTIPHYNERQR